MFSKSKCRHASFRELSSIILLHEARPAGTGNPTLHLCICTDLCYFINHLVLKLSIYLSPPHPSLQGCIVLMLGMGIPKPQFLGLNSGPPPLTHSFTDY